MTETIYFKVKMEKNPDVMISGYVDINDEDVDWYYDDDASGIPTPHIYYEHLGIDGLKGATDEQRDEIEEFKNILLNNLDFLDIIPQSEEGEKFTITRFGLIVEVEGSQYEEEI